MLDFYRNIIRREKIASLDNLWYNALLVQWKFSRVVQCHVCKWFCQTISMNNFRWKANIMYLPTTTVRLSTEVITFKYRKERKKLLSLSWIIPNRIARAPRSRASENFWQNFFRIGLITGNFLLSTENDS